MAVTIPGTPTYPVSGTPFPAGSSSPSPVYSGVFIPSIWASKLVEKFYDSTVLSAISNTDYEGEIRNQGDHVIIRTKPDVSIKDYSADQALEFERPSSDVVEMLIDKGKYWNVILDDVMEVQSDMNLMSTWADDAAQQMKITIDRDVLRGIFADVNATNVGATAGRLSANINLGVTVTTPISIGSGDQASTGHDVTTTTCNVVQMALRLGQVLDEQNVSGTGRFLVIPAWAAAQIKATELRQVQVSGDSTSMLRSGFIGNLDRFEIYVSNLLPNGVADGLAAGEYEIFAGTKEGLSFASQVTKVETLRSEQTFGNLMRGLQVYGYKVVNDVCLAAAVVTQA